MRILIIRHAQSANNAGGRARVADPHLTDTGQRQAELLAGQIHQFDIDLLYVSPMRRTLETVAPLASVLGLQARVFTALHEWGGVYEDGDDGPNHLPGLSRTEMESIAPGIIMPEDVTHEGWWPGELDTSRLEAVVEQSRSNAERYLDYLARQYPEDVAIGVVTHGGFGSNLMEAALHVAPHPDFILRFHQANTGHALIEISPDDRILRWHNRTDHLPDDLVTA